MICDQCPHCQNLEQVSPPKTDRWECPKGCYRFTLKGIDPGTCPSHILRFKNLSDVKIL